MKLLDFIFAKPKKQEKSKWTIESNGWEANARRYNQKHGLPAKQIQQETHSPLTTEYGCVEKYLKKFDLGVDLCIHIMILYICGYERRKYDHYQKTWSSNF